MIDKILSILTAGPCVSLREVRSVLLFAQVSRVAWRSEAEPHWYGSPISLADQGNLGVPGEPGAPVEPSGAGLVAAGPCVPADDVPGRPGPGSQGGEQALDLRDGQRDQPWIWRWLPTGPGRAVGTGAAAQQRGGDGADRQGGHDQHGVAGDRGVEPGLALVEPEAVLAELEIFFYWPAEPGGADQPGLGQQLSFGHPAVVKGQLAGLEVAADQQVMAR